MTLYGMISGITFRAGEYIAKLYVSPVDASNHIPETKDNQRPRSSILKINQSWISVFDDGKYIKNQEV